MNNNLREAARWIEQAEADLQVAKWNYEGKFWWEVCFKGHQVSEKALKAYRYAKGERAVLGHSLVDLLRGCKKYKVSFQKLEMACRRLDKYYLTARYPDGLPGLTPVEYFDEEEAKQALDFAQEILDLVKDEIEALSSGSSQ